MKMNVEQAIERVREGLLRERGNWLRVLEYILQKNPQSKITYRWMVGFAGKQDLEPKFSRVAELGAAIGVEVNIVVNHCAFARYTEVKHGIQRSGRKVKRPRNSARGSR
jgi:hypothetical protein